MILPISNKPYEASVYVNALDCKVGWSRVELTHEVGGHPHVAEGTEEVQRLGTRNGSEKAA